MNNLSKTRSYNQPSKEKNPKQLRSVMYGKDPATFQKVWPPQICSWSNPWLASVFPQQVKSPFGWKHADWTPIRRFLQQEIKAGRYTPLLEWWADVLFLEVICNISNSQTWDCLNNWQSTCRALLYALPWTLGHFAGEQKSASQQFKLFTKKKHQMKWTVDRPWTNRGKTWKNRGTTWNYRGTTRNKRGHPPPKNA